MFAITPQINNEIAVARGVVLPLLGTVLVYYLYKYLFRRPAVFAAPTKGVRKHGGHVDSSATNVDEVLRTNYPEYRDRFFKIREAHGDTLILPVKYLEELKALPQDILSFEKGLYERMQGKHTGMSSTAYGNTGRTFPTSINQNLTRSLNELMKVIHEECQYAFETHIGPCEDWTEVRIFEKLVVIVSLISGRIFIGPEMNRDPEYMSIIIKYTLEVFTAVGAMQQVHPWFKDLYVWLGWVPEVNQIRKSREDMRRILEPILKQRLEALETGQELPNDMVTWNMLNSPANVRTAVDAQAHNQLQASMAAIHTTSMTGSHVIFDLASRPECQKPLQEELAAVMAQERVPYLSKTSTPKLRLLDSFCKESQRVNPLGPMTFARLVMRDITLHDGTVLPAGTHLAVASGQRGTDSAVYDDPGTFRPWRFAKMREEKGHESRHQFVTSSPDSLGWGFGNHACPGRFFANNELKVIVTYILANYDIMMPDGQGRPVNKPRTGGARPDTSQCILMRKRADVSG